jgi:hypothetical protein
MMVMTRMEPFRPFWLVNLNLAFSELVLHSNPGNNNVILARMTSSK